MDTLNERTDTVLKIGSECHTNGPLRSPQELSGCHVVYGSIHILPNATDGGGVHLRTIYGCVRIEDTFLTNLDFLLNVDIQCKKPGGSRIYKNSKLCMNDRDRKRLNIPESSYSIEYRTCPLCTEKDLNSYQFKRCEAFMGDIVINEKRRPDLTRLRQLYGRLIIANTTLPSFKSKLAIRSKDWRPAVSISNLTEEPSNVLTLYNVYVETYARYAVEIVNTPGYLVGRHILAKLREFFKRGVKADTEEDHECFFPNGTQNIDLKDITKCETLMGRIRLNLQGCYATTSIKNISTMFDVEISEHDGSIIYSLQFLQDVFLERNNTKIRIYLDGKTCFKEQIMTFARAWVPVESRDRVEHISPPSCDTYEGLITLYDVRNTTGADMKHIIGGLNLLAENVTEITWTKDVRKFDHLQTIKKQPYLAHDYPALWLSMCSSVVDLPGFIFKVNISSYRDDDILIRIGGPGYKMPMNNYSYLVGKYGEHRLDISPQHEGDCSFSKPILRLEELDGCDRIVGDMIFDPKISGNTSAIIRQISGCVQIKGTKLSSLDFIQLELPYDPTNCIACRGEGSFMIMHNSYLCANHWMFSMDAGSVKQNKPNCGNDLGIEAYPTTNIVIHGEFNESEYREFAVIRELKGKIVITGSMATKLNIFPNLYKIEYMGPGPAILIDNNPNLRSFDIPTLKEIKVRKGNKAVVMRNNPKLNITAGQETLYRHAAKEAPVEVEKPAIVEETKKEVKKKHESHFRDGLGYGMLAACGIVVLGSVVVVTAILVRKRMSKSKKDKKKKNPKDGDKKEDKKSTKSVEKNGNGENKQMKSSTSNEKMSKDTKLTAKQSTTSKDTKSKAAKRGSQASKK